MCGIAGIWKANKSEGLERSVKKMTDAISHRGPDGEGHWLDINYGIALGHRRLSVIDLSDNASQPMHYLDRYIIVFNGEIYNYLELKSKLKSKGYSFKSYSDTEVLIASYAEWGVKCLEQLDAMFSFAIFDRKKKELFCARDRFGEKPFFYSDSKNNFSFCSEIKGLKSIGLATTKEMKMIHDYLVHDLVENPRDQSQTFYEDIYKLKPGHYILKTQGEPTIQKCYWSIDTKTTSNLSFKESCSLFLEILEKSVQRRLRSDIPVGSSLSGGLDSSTIVALMSKKIDQVNTFSARFPGFDKDEGRYIKQISSLFHTNHFDVYVDGESLMKDLDKLVYHQDEPFQTGSIYAQFCVYKESRKQGVPVMLDGQGADEYLAGYHKDFKYFLLDLPNGLDKKRIQNALYHNHKFKYSLSKKDFFRKQFPNLYELAAKFKHTRFSQSPSNINKAFHKAYGSSNSPFIEMNDLKSMLKHEMSSQGLEKLLRFCDRNAMAHSVEVRLPFLSHELVSFVFSLKSDFLLKNGWSKSILRSSVENILPKDIVRRKDKIGFEAPQDEWVKSPHLQDQFKEAETHLIKNRVITSGRGIEWKTIIASKFLKDS